MNDNVNPEDKQKIVKYIIQTIGINETMKNFQVPEDLIEENIDGIDWDLVSHQKELSIDFIKKWSVDLNWSILSRMITDESMVNEFSDFIEWESLPVKKYSNDFIERWSDRLDWNKISLLDDLSEEFIEKWEDKINWNYISCNRIEYTSNFLQKYKDKLDWNVVQILIDINDHSSMIEDLIDKIDLNRINLENVSDDILEKYKDRISDYNTKVDSIKLKHDILHTMINNSVKN
jgi:hypothetical protein